LSKNLYLVFLQPGDSIDEKVFNSHVDDHIPVVLEVPGFLACRRYHLALTNGGEYPSRYGYLNLYEVDGSAADLYRVLHAPGRGGPGHPDWWVDVSRSESFSEAIEGELSPTESERLFFVFSSPTADVSSEDFVRWYAEHAAQNVRATSFLGEVSRYRVEPLSEPGDVGPEHLALYTLFGTPAEMLAETHAAQSRGEVSSTEGLHVFASFEASAIGDRQVAGHGR
jgi:hypothetical protein